MKRILLVIGMPGSGKEEFVRVAIIKGISVVRMGDVVREFVAHRGLTLEDKNIGEIAHREREVHGYGIWAIRIVPRIKSEFTVVDGCRGDAEVKVFKENFKMKLVGIFSSPQTRFERLKSRARTDAPIAFEDFLERDRRELIWGIGNAFIQADSIIVNEGSLERFRADVSKLLDAFLRSESISTS